MESTYRNDLGAAEERLARLEAAHVERRLQALRERRGLAASAEPPPASQTTARRLGFGLMGVALLGLSITTFASVILFGSLGVAIFVFVFSVLAALWGAVSLFASGSVSFRRWHHRRAQSEVLAELDTQIAAIESAPRRIDVSTLEAVHARIAELEAEEASVAMPHPGPSSRSRGPL